MESLNSRLMNLTVNLWAKGSHDVIKSLFHEHEFGGV